MNYVKLDSNGNIEYVHRKPFDENVGLGKTEEELLQYGVLVEELPEPDISDPNKISVLKYDGNKFYYEYSPRPLTKEEQTKQEIESLKLQNAQMIFALVEGGLM